MHKIDLNENLILIKNSQEQRYIESTDKIELIIEKDDIYSVKYKSGDKIYSYNKSNIKVLKRKDDPSIDYGNNGYDNIKEGISKLTLYEGGYYKAILKNGNTIIRKKSNNKGSKMSIKEYYENLFEYLETIVEEDTPLYYLSSNYKRVIYSEDSSLDSYFNKRLIRKNKDREIIVPFRFNQSQYKAIENALTSNISVIEGPPGTGKTQTILNLLSNLVYRDKTCAIVSNNNAAINNINDKLKEHELSGFIAQLGSMENTLDFFDNNQKSMIDNKKKLKSNIYFAERKIETLHNQVKYLQDLEVLTAKKKEKLRDIKNEKRHYSINEQLKTNLNKSLSSKWYIRLIDYLQNNTKYSIVMRLYVYFLYRVKLTKVEHLELLDDAKKMYYISKEKEYQKVIEANEKILDENKISDKIKEIQEISNIVLSDHLIKRANSIGKEEFNNGNYKSKYDKFLKRYPVILSTTQSLQNNMSNKHLFDYLIIDEASQADILKSTLALNCAKNLVVVGDSKQLSQIEEHDLVEYSKKVENENNIPSSYRYVGNSILDSIKKSIPRVPTTLLKEHYRSAPDIIQFCNKMFYNNELVPMTKNTGNHIEIIKTVPGNHARRNPNGSGMYNQREIDEVISLIENSEYTDIGIISPFRYQADLIEKEINENNKTIESDTVHKFQGREKEKVIFSLTVNSLEEHSENSHLREFVNDEKLINVSISRSVEKINLIVSDKVYNSDKNLIKDFIDYSEYIYGNSISRESDIKSIFDNLYSDYKKHLLNKYNKNPNMHKSELLMVDLIDKVLKDFTTISYSMHITVRDLINIPSTYNYEDRRYLNNPWTHVDFVFYNNVTKKTLFILEVDGIKYHEQNPQQLIKDQIKDRAFRNNNINVYRFKTNESMEEQKLRKIIEEYI